MYFAWAIRYFIALFQFLYENDTVRLVVLSIMNDDILKTLLYLIAVVIVFKLCTSIMK